MTPSSNRNHAQFYWDELFFIPLITAVTFFAVVHHSGLLYPLSGILGYLITDTTKNTP